MGFIDKMLILVLLLILSFSFLAGEGALNWALKHGFSGCLDKDLITGKSFQLLINKVEE